MKMKNLKKLIGILILVIMMVSCSSDSSSSKGTLRIKAKATYTNPTGKAVSDIVITSFKVNIRKIEFEVAEGTQTGRTYRLRGKGIKGIRSTAPGDLYVHVQIETPVKLNEEQRKLIQSLEKSLQADSRKHNPQERGWIDKVKGFFN
jgi:DnaJ-class molecular chaperone